MKMRDYALLCAVLMIAVAAQLLFMGANSAASEAVVYISGVEAARFSLDSDYSFKGDGAVGQYELEITSGSARLTDSTCPDKLCVRQGAISESGQTIICLPNQLLIQLTGGDVDAVAY